jgi:2-polyprenyl-3-methyl-5-hydroxy-6-metoxy-1,4-benzoquinol methylase
MIDARHPSTSQDDMDIKPNLEQQEGYYTERWNAFAFANKLDLARVTAVLETLSHIGFDDPPEICDLGCGAGWATSIFGHFGKTTGVDLSDTTQAALRYPNCAFLSANILEWDAPKEAFDVVVSLEVIEHIERPLQAKYVEVAHRLLRPGGHFIITTPNANTMRAMAKGGREWSNQPLEEWLTPSELRAVLATRFDVRDVRSIIPEFGVRGSYRVMNSGKIRGAMQAIGRGDAWESMQLRAMYGLHLVAHAQKSRRG